MSFTTQTTTNAFAAVMEAMAVREPVLGETWNGDVNYASLEDASDKNKMAELLLEFGQKLVCVPSAKVKGAGSKRKAQPKSLYDFEDRLPRDRIHHMKTQMKGILDHIRGAKDMIRPVYIDMLARFIFRERAISSGSRASEGKGNRDISYYIFFEFIKEMPDLDVDLIPLFPHYGSFQDYNHLLAHSLETGNTDIANMFGVEFAQALDKDLRKMIGIGLNHYNGDVATISQVRDKLDTFRKEVIAMNGDERKKLHQKLHLSLAGKWFPRPDSSFGKKRQERRKEHGKEPHGTHEKRFSRHREFLMAHFFFTTETIMKAGPMYKKPVERWNALSDKQKTFYETVMRWFTSTINLILDVPETLMSENKWDQIDPTAMPSGAVHQHRLALLNETVGETLSLGDMEDGNRSSDPARIALRKTMTKAAVDGALKGATLDCVKFANVIWSGNGIAKNFSSTERLVLHAQFMALVDDIRTRAVKEYDEALATWEEKGSDPASKPVDPLFVIATIDVSGSMGSAGVMGAAIILGIITTLLSKLGRSFITFHDNPTVITLLKDGDIVDWVKQVADAPWGGSTDMDKAMHKLVDIMEGVREQDASFTGNNASINHIIFTDGQFNNRFCRFAAQPDYRSSIRFNEDSAWSTFADRMSNMFAKHTFPLPRTTFWNMNSRSPGFPATSGKKGLILLEGLSQGLMMSALGSAVTLTAKMSALGSAVTLTVNEKGHSVAAIDPVDMFLRSIYREDFDNVTAELLDSDVHGLNPRCIEVIDHFATSYRKVPLREAISEIMAKRKPVHPQVLAQVPEQVRAPHVLDPLITRAEEMIAMLTKRIKENMAILTAPRDASITEAEQTYNIEVANHFLTKYRADLATQEKDHSSLVTARGY
jgi:hypothetical protein